MRRVMMFVGLLAVFTLSPAAQPARLSVGGVAYTVEKLLDADYPVALAFAPDGRLFYTEKVSGNVRVVSPEGVLQAEPVISLPVDSLAERGLLGIAIDPAHA
ncbi:MAG: PQQ-dependent sugar dehydrogenase, partial [Anaerolineae bacterium]|nr:PQQ-dependent sugar dehydrogenase [Anaerolineae bacterium]